MARLSPDLTARLVGRWQALEAEANKPQRLKPWMVMDPMYAKLRREAPSHPKNPQISRSLQAIEMVPHDRHGLHFEVRCQELTPPCAATGPEASTDQR